MVSLQIISKILQSQDNSIVDNNLLTNEYFVGYEDEFNFIQNHIKEYGNVPDKSTFLAKFPSLELVDVTESDSYLVDTIREEFLYYKSVPVLQKAADLLKSDANVAAEFLITALKDLQPNYNLGGKNIVADALARYQQFVDRKTRADNWYFTTGFEELDDLMRGLQRGEELVVLFARLNQGKSWVLEKIMTHIWQIGYNVGYISPEMSADSIGYRFDTLYKNFSNSGLMWGKDGVSDEEYKSYIEELAENKAKFIVATPLDFNRVITVTKLRNFVIQNKLDALAIDGITYVTDERYKRGDTKTTSLTNISEDLMTLSMELKIPIIIVVQANRSGVVDKDSSDTPELESIRDSDGIGHNASKVISLHQRKSGILDMTIKKQRFGPVGGKLTYQWDIDKGDFLFLPNFDDAQDKSVTEEKVKDIKQKFSTDKADVF